MPSNPFEGFLGGGNGGGGSGVGGAVRDARDRASKSGSRNLLHTLLSALLGIIFNGFIGFIVQALFFGNVSWNTITSMATGKLSGGDSALVIITCVFWEIWVIAAFFYWVLVVVLKSNFMPHWPGTGRPGQIVIPIPKLGLGDAVDQTTSALDFVRYGDTKTIVAMVFRG